jgi:hypothetical protein
MGIDIQKVVLAPVADFSFDDTNDPQISFTDLSTNSPNNWLWDFDDGNTSNQQNPTYTYASSGNYNVCLIATNSGGSDTICKPVTVSNVLPVANFSIDSINMPTIAFTDQSINNPTAWLWDFDDTGDDTASVQNPVYEFKTNGSHSVCLTATNSFGSSSPFCYSLNIYGVGMAEYNDDLIITVFPNPVNQNTLIQIRASEISEKSVLKLYNILGEEIQTSISIIGNKIEIETNSLNKGSYFFDLYNDNELVGKGKFIIN